MKCSVVSTPLPALGVKVCTLLVLVSVVLEVLCYSVSCSGGLEVCRSGGPPGVEVCVYRVSLLNVTGQIYQRYLLSQQSHMFDRITWLNN